MPLKHQDADHPTAEPSVLDCCFSLACLNLGKCSVSPCRTSSIAAQLHLTAAVGVTACTWHESKHRRLSNASQETTVGAKRHSLKMLKCHS